jgi:hypothetical protein
MGQRRKSYPGEKRRNQDRRAPPGAVAIEYPPGVLEDIGLSGRQTEIFAERRADQILQVSARQPPRMARPKAEQGNAVPQDRYAPAVRAEPQVQRQSPPHHQDGLCDPCRIGRQRHR